ncbi:tumor protein D52-like isoform X1 [Limulus polyphemus]|uniref:Tumor protein D52-like isoform X1 n=1 Tax=Limulus polyphemus TaxID=6850 RepID=A0ABM1C2Z9_LIMPO|nr:tumor protein D52-like isoform X1 [Limulus polyphemus]
MERQTSLEEDCYEEPGTLDFSSHSYAFTEATVRNGQIVVHYDDLSKPFSMTSEEEVKYQNFLKLASAEAMEELDVGEEDAYISSTQKQDISKMYEDFEEKAKLEAEWKEELSKIDDEILAIRQVMEYKLKRSQELKQKLGITPWVEFKEDMEQGIRHIQESCQKTSQKLKNAGERTSTAFGNIGTSMSKKFEEVKNSQTYKAIEEKVETAYENVKSRIPRSKNENPQNVECTSDGKEYTSASDVSSESVTEQTPTFS